MMRARIAKSLGFAAGLLTALISGAPALADDTELFVAAAAPSSGVQPNILFILDTSGSMRSTVNTQVPFDPAFTYAGFCDKDRVYWRRGTGNPPDCATDRWFKAKELECDLAAQAFQVSGFYTDRMAQWDDSPDRWRRLSRNRKSDEVECRNDGGVHGDGDPDDLWAADGNNGPWSDDANDEVSWSGFNTGRTYTVYSGNYLNWFFNSSGVSQTRIAIMQQVLDALLDSIDGVNVGLMRFMNNGGSGETAAEGGPVIHAIEDIATARAAMKTKVSALTASGWTPLSETLYEAGQYYASRAVEFGLPAAPIASVPESRSVIDQSLYQSPTQFSCQKNFIVLLTDGAPTQDNNADARIRSLPGFSTNVGPDCDGSGWGRCLDDMAEYLYDADLNNSVSGQNNVTTYTIGFNVNLPILQTTATRGGGQYYTANDTAGLLTVLTNIVTQILQENTTYTAPAVSVNAFNRTQNLNDLFITVFRPSGELHWPGNLKKYQLVGGSIVGSDGTTAVVDPAIGFFKDTAQSFWSSMVDGADVSLGGAAENLPDANSRNVYTYTGGAADLTAAANRFEDANGALTDAMLNLGNPGDPTRTDLINWGRGLDVLDEDQDNSFTDSRNVLGDPMHAKPASVIYGGTLASPDAKDAVIFTATNDGYVHAITADTGVEMWAFIPPVMLASIHDLYIDDPTPDKHYGIDGNLVALKVDINQNGIVEPGGGDKVFLFFGMRRGGDQYYAMDITDKNAPKLLWVRDANDFPLLGQTWSTPTLSRMVINGAAQNPDYLTLTFGGGYDTTQDNPLISTDVQGTGIYIIDTISGNLLWRAGPDGGADLQLGRMQFSIPAGVRVIDVDNDQFADRMYAADMGGQVWRFDIFNGQPVGTFMTGGAIASLGAADSGIPTVLNSRRFYNATDVALFNKQDIPYLNIAIGSGYRAHPLNMNQEDRFYSIRDYDILGKLSQPQYDALTPLSEVDLADVSNDLTPVLPPNAKGWFLDLPDVGEKVLAEARTFDNKIFFSTFTPGSSGNGCIPSQGRNKLYVVAVENGSPVTDLDDSGDPNNLTLTDRSRDLAQGGIAPETVFLFPPPTDPNDPLPPPECLIGLENCTVGLANLPVRTFWTQDGAE